MKKRILSMLLAIVMVVGLMPGSALTALAADEIYYHLWVGDQQITSANAADVFGDGTVSYVPASNTLTLNGFEYTGSGYNSAAIRCEGTGTMNLYLLGNSTVTHTGGDYSYGVYTNGSLVISGDGSLTVTGGNAGLSSYGVHAPRGSITVSGNGSLTAIGGSANQISNGVLGSTITVSGGEVIARGATAAFNSPTAPIVADTLAVYDADGKVIAAPDWETLTYAKIAESNNTSSDPTTYTAVGAIAPAHVDGGIFGTAWNPSVTENDLTWNESTGRYEITYTNVPATGRTLTPPYDYDDTWYEFKIVENHAWDKTYNDIAEDTSGINATFDVEVDGSTVVIAFDGKKALVEVIPPAPATTYPLWVGGEQFTSAKLTVNGTTGTATYDPTTNTLTLENYTYSGEGYTWMRTIGSREEPYGAAICYFGKEALNLVLKGTNSITNTGEAEYSYGFYAEATQFQTNVSGSGSLTVAGNYCSFYTLASLTITDSASLTVNKESTNDAVYVGATLGITDNGSLNVISKDVRGVRAGFVNLSRSGRLQVSSTWGLMVTNVVTVSDAAVLDVSAERTGVDCRILTVNGGMLTVSDAETGISVQYDFNMTGGTVTVSGETGVEIGDGSESSLVISGGKLTVTGTAEAGISAWGGTPLSVVVNDGEVIASGVTAALNNRNGTVTIADTLAVYGADGKVVANPVWTGEGALTYAKIAVKPVTHSVYVSAVDAANGAAIKGAHLLILDEQSIVIAEWESGGGPDTLEGLHTGETYTIHATVASSGYTIPDAVTFSIDETGKVITSGRLTEDGVLLLAFERTAVKVNAVDAEGHALAGADLEILDPEGNIVNDWVSDGEAEEIIGLHTDVVYTIVPAAAPNGYTIPDAVTFSINETGKVTASGDIDANGTLLIGFERTEFSVKALDAYGAAIEGATLQILNAQGSAVAEWTSGADDESTEDTDESVWEVLGLRAGESYTLKVVVTPNGYLTPGNLFFFLEKNGKVVYDGEAVTDNVLLLTFAEAVPAITSIDFNRDSEAYDAATNTFYVDEEHPLIITVRGEHLKGEKAWFAAANAEMGMIGYINVLFEEDAAGSNTMDPDTYRLVLQTMENYGWEKNIAYIGASLDFFSLNANDFIPLNVVEKTYEADITQPEGGEVSTDRENPVKGDQVTITVTPDEGKEVVEVVVKDENGDEVDVKDNGDGTYTYEQPAGDVTVEVELKTKSYTVTFVDWDNKELKSETVEHGKSAAAPADPTREGWKFTGWDTDFSHVTGDLTVGAQYEEKQTIEIDLTEQVYTYDGTPKPFAIKGEVTDGFTVEYAGGTVPVNGNIIYHVLITRPEDDTYKSFREFSYLTIYPKLLTDSDITFTIAERSYVYDGEGKMPTVTVKHGDTVLTQGTVGDTLGDFYTTGITGATKVGVNRTIVNGRNNYAGGVMLVWEILPTFEAEAPAKPGEDGKIVLTAPLDSVSSLEYATSEDFTGAKDFDASGTQAVAPGTYYVRIKALPDKEMPDGSITLGYPASSAVEVVVPATYSITFDTDGGSEVAPIYGTAGSAITAPAAPTKTGHTFAGWDKEIPAVMPAENITLTAQWTVDVYDADITQPEGGDVSTDKDNPIMGEEVTITVTPDEGKEVVDVVVKDENGDEVDIKDNGDGTYTYEQPAGDVEITVELKDTEYEADITQPEGGTVETDKEKPIMGEEVTITVTLDEGKEVVDVVVKDENGDEVDVKDNGDGTYTYEQPAGDVEITVEVKSKTYTVTLVTNGGIIRSGNVTGYTHGVGAKLPTNVTRSGCFFGGWYDNEDCKGIPVTEITTADIGNKTFYARWTYIHNPITSPNPTYPPVVDGGDNGDVSVTPKNPEKGGTVVITPDPDDGYEVDEIIVTDKKGNPVTVIDNGDGTYSFKQPGGKVNIEVTFKEIVKVCPGDRTCPMYGYTDLDMTAWYHDGVHFCIEHGLMQGIGDNRFAPNGTTTRAMIVTILWRLAGEPVVNYAMSFEDVAADTWYTEAIRWAASEGIVKGYSDTAFGPNDNINREQLATILYRCEQKNGGGFKGMWMFRMDYVDLADVSDWAYEAMCWMNMNSIVNGKPGKVLDPKGNATRAEAATVLYRYCEVIGKDEEN